LRTPIIMLTAKAQELEKVVGLDLGADDYITKPFSPRELRARIRAVLRRGATDAVGETYRFGSCELDMARFELRRDGRQVEATHTELKLLAAFLRARGRVLTRETLLDQAWGAGVFVTDRVVDNHIVALRKKIEDDPSAPRYLITIRGVGYRFDG
jgi:DNA-binding response OmpR family regulator